MLPAKIDLPQTLLAAFAAAASPAAAQFETATVLGSVRDKTGAVVPGATVTLLNLDTGVSQSKPSDEVGNYEFFTVRIGTYKVTAELAGFASAMADQVKVTVGSRQRVDLVLAPGSVAEAIEVSAEVSQVEEFARIARRYVVEA